jgi:hypothetical protein
MTDPTNHPMQSRCEWTSEMFHTGASWLHIAAALQCNNFAQPQIHSWASALQLADVERPACALLNLFCTFCAQLRQAIQQKMRTSSTHVCCDETLYTCGTGVLALQPAASTEIRRGTHKMVAPAAIIHGLEPYAAATSQSSGMCVWPLDHSHSHAASCMSPAALLGCTGSAWASR